MARGETGAVDVRMAELDVASDPAKVDALLRLPVDKLLQIPAPSIPDSGEAAPEAETMRTGRAAAGLAARVGLHSASATLADVMEAACEEIDKRIAKA
eukprot:tig00001409_g8625.t1